MEDGYDMSIRPFEGNDSYEKYDKDFFDDFERINSCFGMSPQLLKDVYTSKFYDGSCRVIYDKGLGILQRAVNKPNFFKVNDISFYNSICRNKLVLSQEHR